MIDKKKNKKIRIYILAVILLLIFLHVLGVLNTAEDYTFEVISNTQNRAFSFLTRIKFSFINFQEAKELKKENGELKKELNELIYENSQLESYKGENQELRTMLNFYEEKEFDYLIAKIIGRDINKDNTLIINRGKNDGIKTGYAVVVDKGMIIGKIIDVKNDLATVLLLTDNLSQLAVSIEESNKTTGLARGEFGLSVKVELIPQDLEISQDQIMISSGLEENIPRGLIIGKVNRITSHDNDLFKSLTISPLVDFEEITVLSVIIPKNYFND